MLDIQTALELLFLLKKTRRIDEWTLICVVGRMSLTNKHKRKDTTGISFPPKLREFFYIFVLSPEPSVPRPFEVVTNGAVLPLLSEC